MWQECFGEIPKGVCICHSCDTPTCINPEHLFLGTQLDNIKDMLDKNRNRGAKGERNGHAKLNKEQIIEIRNSTLSSQELQKVYNVGESTIFDVKHRRTWKHI
jgi:hypothetical protein